MTAKAAVNIICSQRLFKFQTILGSISLCRRPRNSAGILQSQFRSLQKIVSVRPSDHYASICASTFLQPASNSRNTPAFTTASAPSAVRQISMPNAMPATAPPMAAASPGISSTNSSRMFTNRKMPVLICRLKIRWMQTPTPKPP